MNKKPAIAIYRKSQLEQACEYEYNFKNPDRKPDALVGIATLKEI